VREAVDAAAALLALADECSLPYLRSAALDFIVDHQAAVAATDGWAALSARQVGLVAGHACGLLARVDALLRDMSAGDDALPPGDDDL
jgi:hypothetical protein